VLGDALYKFISLKRDALNRAVGIRVRTCELVGCDIGNEVVAETLRFPGKRKVAGASSRGGSNERSPFGACNIRTVSAHAEAPVHAGFVLV
jgi:hypothetical protein